MKFIVFTITLFIATSLISAPVVIKSKKGRLREVILEIDKNPYTAPELIVGASGVSVIFFPGIVQGCELSFSGYDYRKGKVNKTTNGLFQEIVLRYDLAKVPKEKRGKLRNHRFSISCSFEYRGKSKYIEFDTVFNDRKRYSFAWIKYADDLKRENINLSDYKGFEFVTLKKGRVTIDDGSIEKAFEKTSVSHTKAKPNTGLKKFESVIIEDGKARIEE